MDMDPKLVAWLGDAYDPIAMTYRVKAGATIKVRGEDADEITLSEPILAHVEAAFKAQGIERDRTLMALNAGTTPGMLGSMRVSDYNKAMAFLNFFTGAAPETGDKSSGS